MSPPPYKERFELLQVEALGLRSRDPSTSLEVQRNIDELFRQVSAIRKLNDINAETLAKVLDASENPSGQPGGGGGGQSQDPDNDQPAAQWQEYQLQFDPSDGTGFGTGTSVQTYSYRPPFPIRFKSFTVTVDYQSVASGQGGIYMLVDGSDVFASVHNLSTNVWYDETSKVISAAAIEGGGASRIFEGQAIRFRHTESPAPSGGMRLTVQAVAEMLVPVTQN